LIVVSTALTIPTTAAVGGVAIAAIAITIAATGFLRWTKDPMQCQAVEILKSIPNSYVQYSLCWHTFDIFVSLDRPEPWMIPCPPFGGKMVPIVFLCLFSSY
jgi:hypothetical protein